MKVFEGQTLQQRRWMDNVTILYCLMVRGGPRLRWRNPVLANSWIKNNKKGQVTDLMMNWHASKIYTPSLVKEARTSRLSNE